MPSHAGYIGQCRDMGRVTEARVIPQGSHDLWQAPLNDLDHRQDRRGLATPRNHARTVQTLAES